MHLISPAVLTDAKGLSIGAMAFFLFVGFLVWAFGWRWHKFWVVFAVTLAAGLLGISAGRTAGMQVLVVGVLVSIAAGLLALEIAKITAFISGGTAAWVAAQAVMPEAQELWAVFLCGGLVGVVLYRLWTMLATSLVGALLFGHATALMIEALAGVNMAELVEKNSAIANGAALGGSLVGLLVQAKTSGAGAEGEAAAESKKEKKEKKEEPKDDEAWWQKVLPKAA